MRESANAETNTTYYDYTVTGTLNYIADARTRTAGNFNVLNFPNERHWFFDVAVKGTSTTGATEAVLTKGDVGYATRAALLADKEENFKAGSLESDSEWTKGFDNCAKKFAGVRHKCSDGSTVWHIYDLSGCTYGEAPAASSEG